MAARTNETVTQLLDAAQDLVRDRGYNAFSYKDLESSVGIRTASIHYHFPAKADLGRSLMERYRAELEDQLTEIDRKSRTATGKLKSFVGLYRATEKAGTVCLCGSMASDRETLPDPLRDAVADYLERSERWVAETIAEGVRAGEFEPAGKPADVAATLVAGLQGGLILARARAGRAVLDSVQRSLWAALGVSRA